MVRIINSKEDLEKFESHNKISDFVYLPEKTTANMVCFKCPEISQYDYLYINKKFYDLGDVKA